MRSGLFWKDDADDTDGAGGFSALGWASGKRGNPARSWQLKGRAMATKAKLGRCMGMGGVMVVVACMSSAIAQGQETTRSKAVRDEAPVHKDGMVRLATYNILNLFDAYDDPSLAGKYNDDCYSYDKTVRAKPEAELKAIAKAIRELDADVLAVQEIESIAALSAFNAEYLEGMGYEHVMSIDVLHERGIEQAVLSRFPITEARVWPHMDLEGVHPEKVGNYRIRQAGRDIAFSRSPLFVRIEVPEGVDETQDESYELALFVVHHKSGGAYSYWRDQETAGVLAKIHKLQEAEPELNIAVLGDFNALVDADSIQAYLGHGMHDMVTPSEGTEGYFTHESRRAIDFILMNSAMAADVMPNTGFVLMTSIRGEGEDYRTTSAPEGFGADHLPVAVDFAPINR